MKYLILYIIFLGIIFFPYSLSIANTCEELFDSEDTASAIKNSLSQVLKTQHLDDLSLEPFSLSGVTLTSETSITFRLKVDPSLSVPVFNISQEPNTSKPVKTLLVPSIDFLNSMEGENSLRYWLIGHELHPYSSNGAFFTPKAVQELAFEAYEQAVESGAGSFLHVAPTGVGKTWVLAQALLDRLTHPQRRKVIIITVDKIHLVDQLFQSVRSAIEDSEIILKNWNTEKHKKFNSAIHSALSNENVTVLAITSQSLKRRLKGLDDETYQRLIAELDSLFIDEAHHLGADKTKNALMKLMEDSMAMGNSRSFLYGSTATPVHHEVSLKDMFDKIHWSYLNQRDFFFKDHESSEVLEQMSIAIERGDLTPFDELYIIGESTLKREQDKAKLFVKEKGLFILNPHYYTRLGRALYSVINDNKKGFIVTATIKESERLSNFLNEFFPQIKFSFYHSGMTSEARRAVLEESEKREGFHYIVAVKALDEGVDMPWLSSYIDLNVNVSVKQMVHRIGRVLRLYEGKSRADILFLSDYRNAQMAEDLLSLLESVNRVRFNRGIEGGQSSKGSVLLGGVGVVGEVSLTRADLLASRDLLSEVARTFWQKPEFVSFEEFQRIVPEVGIKSSTEYQQWRKKHLDMGMPSNPDIFYKNHGWPGWDTIFGKKKVPLEEFIRIVREAEITSRTYGEWRKKHLGMPSDPAIFYKAHGWPGWNTIFGKKKVPLEEFIRIVREAEITSVEQYRQWQKDHPEMPSDPAKFYKDHGWPGWNTIFGKKKVPFEEFIRIVREAEITSVEQYRQWQKDHPEMPSDLAKFYKDHGWPGWKKIFGKKKVSFEEFIRIVREAEITSVEQYRQWQKDHPEMPSDPAKFYKAHGWPGWNTILGKKKVPKVSFEEFIRIVHEAEIKSRAEYREWQKGHPDMPSNPDISYKNHGWPGWNTIFGKKKVPLEEFIRIVREAEITSRTYREWRKKHLGMPSDPAIFYKAHGWPGWNTIFGKKKVSFEEFIRIVHEAEITSVEQYRQWQKDHPEMPSDPAIFYKAHGWPGWNTIFGKKKVPKVSFEEFIRIVREAEITSRAEYREWRKKHLNMPSHPEKVYKANWPGWKAVLGKE